MGLAENRAKSAKMAKDLIARGYPHGRRQSKPYPNSGGSTMTWGSGSSKAQRRTVRRTPGGEGGN